ncbi:hypothetical protein [Actinomadura verrucosospora]|uniref:Uncharacterized protein n=1 Tax=Actinomadura verrucosospora TaxID=46165 RepID=A0A7D3VY43_ACTVE|nr:hypothetical protein [Actinomadura verrucosospora]QKG26180.1 hypothetical protein ACTIVE_7833 [Actinomadura verrucosospora]
MRIQQTAWRDADRLSELSAEFAGWRIGRGGSGHWWAVRGNDLVRTPDVEELRGRLRELTGGSRYPTESGKWPD